MCKKCDERDGKQADNRVEQRMLALRGQLRAFLTSLPGAMENAREEACALLAMLQWESANLTVDHDLNPDFAVQSYTFAYAQCLLTELEDEEDDEAAVEAALGGSAPAPTAEA